MSKENKSIRCANALLDELIGMSDEEFAIFISNNSRVVRMIVKRLQKEPR